MVNTKPPDWFDGGSALILADFCRCQERLEQVWDDLLLVKTGSMERKDLLAEQKIMRNGWMTAARELRLTVQHAIERHSSRAGESGPLAKDELLGGTAVRLKKAA